LKPSNLKRISREVLADACELSDLQHFRDTGGLSGILLRIKDVLRSIERYPGEKPGTYNWAFQRGNLTRMAALAVVATDYTDKYDELFDGPERPREVLLEVPPQGGTDHYEDYVELLKRVSEMFQKGDRDSLNKLNDYYTANKGDLPREEEDV